MHNAPLLPQPKIPNYTEPQDQNLQNEQQSSKNSTGGELAEITIDKVRRIIIRGQIDGA